ncbi:MAG: acetylglutamate kinase [Bacteroidota bacterium]
MSTRPVPRASLRVVKLGGAVASNPEALVSLWARLGAEAETPAVIVHGGGPQATALARRLGHEPRIVAGRRVTSDLDLDVALYVMRGAINARLVASASAAGLRAVGVSGADGRLVEVVRRPPREIDGETVDFGRVGDVVGADPSLLNTLRDNGFLPIVASVCADREGALYNVNADTVALEIAVALGAGELVLVAEAGGVYREYPDLGSLMETLTPGQVDAGVREGWIVGGMRPKLEVAREALRRGVPSVRVAAPSDLSGGTLIVPESLAT